MTPSRPGSVNGAGSAIANFLMVFSGEVLTAFREKNVMKALHTVRTIQSGKSAQFIASWKATAAYHTPGTQLLGQTIKSNERTIAIDDKLVADVSIADVDEAMSHFDFRSEYVFQCAAALAKKYDQNLQQLVGLAARASASVEGGNGGSQVTDADARTNADSLAASIYDAGQALDEKDVPEEGRVALLKPAQYNLLVRDSTKGVHRDYSGEGNGSFAKGNIAFIDNIALVKTNNLPSTDVASGPDAYQGDFTNTAALVFQRGAVGTVQLRDLSTEMEWLIEYQTHLLLAKYLLGHGVLRPECAVEIKVA